MSLLTALAKARASGDPDLLALADFAAAKLAEHPHHQRDLLLRQCASLPVFAGKSPRAVAIEIESGWRRYADIPGDRERGLKSCPPHRIGRPEQYYFELNRMGHRPLKYRRILTTIGGC